jgi:hypothetical protein
MYVSVDTACGDDELFACDYFCAGADNEVRGDGGHDVWVARFADTADEALFNTYVCLLGALVGHFGM